MLQQLRDDVEIVIVVNANDIEKNKVRGDLGITYDDDCLRLMDSFRSLDLYVGSIVITQYAGQSAADAFIKRLDALGVRHYLHYPIAGYPSDAWTRPARARSLRCSATCTRKASSIAAYVW